MQSDRPTLVQMRRLIALSCLVPFLLACDPQPVVVPLEPSQFLTEDGSVAGQEGWKLRPLAVDPTVTRAEAVELARTRGPWDPAGARLEAHYGLFTSEHPRRARTGQLQFEDVPAWVIVMDGAEVCVERPMLEVPQKDEECEAQTVFVVVDARTGTTLMSATS